MSHRKKEKLENKKNKNQRTSEEILQQFIRDLDNDMDILRNKIKMLKKLKEAIRWSLT